MPARLRELAPHVVAMLALYVLFVTLVAAVTGTSRFWTSLLIAMIIAVGYPPIIRRMGWAPEPWKQ